MQMHPLLQPILPTGITILLWCVCSAAAALVQPNKNNEPQPLPDSPPTPFTVVVRTDPHHQGTGIRGALADPSYGGHAAHHRLG
jgi:hypothetical protein